jgi:hypothetical protein
VRLYLDSPRVRSWNEIDAVGLVDQSGATHWATEVRASTTYASRNSSQNTGTLEQVNKVAPGWLHVTWQSAPDVPPVSESRIFVARGWPMPSLWGEVQPSYAAIDPLILRHPAWIGLAVDSLSYGVGLFAIYHATFGLRRFVRESLRLRRGCCMRCGYDLRFDLARGCPECGWRRGVD